MRRVLPRKFFNRPTLLVARELLGKYLVARRPDGIAEARMILEVEVYDGHGDRASHASRGRTPRNAPMFGKPGRWYVYFIYGMHEMLNIVTREEGYPAAVLIRSVEGICGPGKVTKAFGVTHNENGKSATRRTGLWIEDRATVVPSRRIKRAARVGVSSAGEVWAKKKWRFVFDPVDPVPSIPQKRIGRKEANLISLRSGTYAN